jgi:hypothetical protein
MDKVEVRDTCGQGWGRWPVAWRTGSVSEEVNAPNLMSAPSESLLGTTNDN